MSFLKTAHLHADALSNQVDAMVRLGAGELGAIIVEGVYPKAQLAKLPALLADNKPDFIKTTFPPAFCAYFFGINLNLADPDLGAYFAAEPDFRDKLAGLDFGGANLQERICGVLSALDEGRPYRAAPGPEDGQRRFFTTLRAHLTGGYIPPPFRQ